MAVAVPAELALGIGIDLFDVGREPDIDSVSHLVLSIEEQRRAMGAIRTGLVFSIKEAAVKAVSAQMGRFLDMREMTVDIAGDTFLVRQAGFSRNIQGRWLKRGPFFLTLALILHTSP